MSMLCIHKLLKDQVKRQIDVQLDHAVKYRQRLLTVISKC